MALFAIDVAELDEMGNEMGEVIVLIFCFDCPEGRGGCTCMKSHPVSSAAMERRLEERDDRRAHSSVSEKLGRVAVREGGMRTRFGCPPMRRLSQQSERECARATGLGGQRSWAPSEGE